MTAPTRRHEPGGFAEEARRIGAQLDEQILDGLVQGFPEAEDPHVRNPQRHLARAIDRPDVQAVLPQDRDEIIRADQQHLLLATMARHDARLMTVEHLGHHVREMALRGREVDRGYNRTAHGPTVVQLVKLVKLVRLRGVHAALLACLVTRSGVQRLRAPLSAILGPDDLLASFPLD